MQFWQIYLLVNLLAAAFIVWPTIFVAKRYKQELRSNARTEANSEVYKDHLSDLEKTLVRGEIDSDELEGLRKDLEKTLVEENAMAFDDSERPIISSFKSRIPVLTLVFALPILSLAIYSSLGAKKDWEIYQLAKARAQAPPSDLEKMSAELILALQDRLQARPDNTQNWYLLAATAVEQGLYEEGVRAFRELLAIQPDAPVVKAELAQALFLRAGNTITPEVRQQTREALQMAPSMPTALGLAGIDAYQSGDYQQAIDFWRQALVQLDPTSAAAQALTGGIARARTAVAKTDSAMPKVAAGPALQVRVSLDGNQVEVQPSDTVFVYARAWQGPKMPLAIKKIKVTDLPADVTLDQSMSMTQGMDLSSFPQVEIVARISSTGSAISQPGDWQAAFGPVIVASQKEPISLTIKEKISP